MVLRFHTNHIIANATYVLRNLTHSRIT